MCFYTLITIRNKNEENPTYYCIQKNKTSSNKLNQGHKRPVVRKLDYLWQIHFDVWQNQYNIVKLKNKIKYIYKKRKTMFYTFCHLIRNIKAKCFGLESSFI